MKRIGVAVLVTLIAVVVSGCNPTAGVTGAKVSKKIAHATIFFYGDPTSGCKAKVSPDPITPEKNYTIDWTVVDLCGLAATDLVTIGWEGADPLDNKIGTGKKRYQGDLKSTVNTGDRFVYKVLVNGVAVADPEIEIVQF